MISFKQYLKESAEDTLLSAPRKQHRDGTYTVFYFGKRQRDAAEKLVKSGRAEKVTHMGEIAGGDRYSSNFGNGHTKHQYIHQGLIHFKEDNK